MSKTPSSLPIITLLFAFFILTVILLADVGRLSGLLQFLHTIPFGDKVGHFFLIGMLCFLTSGTAMRIFPRRQSGQVVALVCLGLAIIFGFEEASQSLLPARKASLFDLLANYAGIAVFGWLAWKCNSRHNRNIW
ncbi:MAG: hypothetical protein Fur0043_17530 [Anaerolineales bacterium]